jgi:hypothetical protein
MAIIHEYTPNAQSLIGIVSPEETAEYVIYFDVVLFDELRNKQFIISEIGLRQVGITVHQTTAQSSFWQKILWGIATAI